MKRFILLLVAAIALRKNKKTKDVSPSSSSVTPPSSSVARTPPRTIGEVITFLVGPKPELFERCIIRIQTDHKLWPVIQGLSDAQWSGIITLKSEEVAKALCESEGVPEEIRERLQQLLK